ncbi:MAG: TldD/PmbA family protein [Candidatus Heimdallarchaeota archaeon]|nr:TldD/PmbA family protein [Candidatus Heimdallarchaeota archaeon]MCK4954090.1 TldD/PmbA family protein [Candidatus Heimdallarchaeota archaeon]
MQESAENLADLVAYGIKCCEKKGVDYADVKFMDTKMEDISFKNESLERLDVTNKKGIGIRCLVNKSWGFASSNELTREKVTDLADLVVKIAKASALVKKFDIEFAEEPIHKATVKTPVKKDPFDVELNEKIDVLQESAIRAKGFSDRIKVANSHYVSRKDHMILYTTEGTKIDQTIIWCGGGVASTAIEGGEVQTRSLPASFRGDFQTKGYEYFESLDLLEVSEKAAKEAVQLLSAEKMPSEKSTIILGHSQLALQVHESCGHPTELDRAIGYEAAYAGTSFLTPDLLGTGFKYGNELVTMVADATVPGGLGTFFYDHEGVEAQRVVMIDKGVFVAFMSSRETAKAIGLERSSGAARAMGYDRIPIIRMTNVNLEPGDWGFDELVADTKNGYFLETNRSWSIDDIRMNFQFGTEIGWKIENGEMTDMIKNPTYEGITPEFWGNVSGICNKEHWKIFGTPNCGKGEPGQAAYVGHGIAPTRFDNVRVGILN